MSTAPTFCLEMCNHSLTQGYRHFFYGGKQGVAERLAGELTRRFPGLHVVGTYTPPFRSLNPAEEDELETLVAETKPDVFWVGLGSPKQERFMAQYSGRLDVKLMVGVGAAFDIHTGGVKRGPKVVEAYGAPMASSSDSGAGPTLEALSDLRAQFYLEYRLATSRHTQIQHQRLTECVVKFYFNDSFEFGWC